MRNFDSGATRDTDEGKLSYFKGLSPIVLEEYLKYLSRHREQANGQMRDWDNWKLGIDFDTYIDSLLRHVVALWKLHYGYEVEDNHGPVDKLETLMAILFNAMGYSYELLGGTENEPN